MKTTQDISIKMNTQRNGKSYNEKGSIDSKLQRRAKAQFRNLKVSLAQSDWE